MKTIIMIISFVAILPACGKKEGAAALTQIKGNDSLGEEIGGSSESAMNVDSLRSTHPGKVKQTLISILTLEADGTLRKLTQSSSCLYQKR